MRIALPVFEERAEVVYQRVQRSTKRVVDGAGIKCGGIGGEVSKSLVVERRRVRSEGIGQNVRTCLSISGRASFLVSIGRLFRT